MALTVPVGVNWTGRLEKFGASTTGDTAQFTLISAFQVSSINDSSQQNQGNIIAIDEFEVGQATATVNGVYTIQKSSDGNTYTNVARMVLDGNRNLLKSMSRPIIIPMGQYCRVIGIQGTIGACYASIRGRTVNSDVVDI